MAILRVTGPVAVVDRRTGTTAGGKDWSMRVARVLNCELDFVEVVLGDSQAEPAQGEFVDWLVDCTGNARGFLNIGFRAALAPASK